MWCSINLIVKLLPTFFWQHILGERKGGEGRVCLRHKLGNAAKENFSFSSFFSVNQKKFLKLNQPRKIFATKS
jgi:hypothetical protein